MLIVGSVLYTIVEYNKPAAWWLVINPHNTDGAGPLYWDEVEEEEGDHEWVCPD